MATRHASQSSAVPLAAKRPVCNRAPPLRSNPFKLLQIPISNSHTLQVHRAVGHDGRQLAVKVQHAGLRESGAVDVATLGAAVSVLRYFAPAFDYRWVVDETRDNLPMVRHVCLGHTADDGCCPGPGTITNVLGVGPLSIAGNYCRWSGRAPGCSWDGQQCAEGLRNLAACWRCSTNVVPFGTLFAT